MTDENNRPDPSDFTGTGRNNDENQEETSEPSQQQEEDISEALEPSEEQDESSWNFTGKIRGILSRESEEDYDVTPAEEDYQEDVSEDEYDENGKDRRGFLYAIAGLGAIGAGAIAADGADGEVDGNFGIFDDISDQEVVPTNESNQTETPTETPSDAQTETPTETPSDAQTPTAEETPVETPTDDSLYFDSRTDLPDEVCYVEEGGVSGYFEVEDVENALGEQPIQGLNPSRGEIAYDVDYRDSDGDGIPDAYVVQLAGTSDQNDLTVEQAETLFEELDVDGSYC